jgi:rhodanese-related sulfurtransferase
MRKINKYATAYLFLMVILILAGCRGAASASSTQASHPVRVIGTPVAVAGGTYEDVTPKVLETMLEKKDFTLINVHIPRSGDIPQTDFSIPYDQIDRNLDRLPADKNAKIILYCSSGHMSSIAAKKLVELGYTNVWELAGGMSAWQKDGYQIVTTK